MNEEKSTSRNTPVPWWQALALLCGGHRIDAAYGFGGPDVAEVTGTAEEIGSELTRFLGGLEWENVEAERLGTGHFAVRVEVEPLEDCPATLMELSGDLPAENPVALWEATAAVGNARGVFDSCYAFGSGKGDEGHLLGNAHELGTELARVLQGLTRGDVETMKYGTDRFFLQLVVELPREQKSPFTIQPRPRPPPRVHHSPPLHTSSPGLTRPARPSSRATSFWSPLC